MPTETAPLVLLTTDDPDNTQAAVALLMATIPEACPVVVICHGDQASECNQAVDAIGDLPVRPKVTPLLQGEGKSLQVASKLPKTSNVQRLT